MLRVVVVLFLIAVAVYLTTRALERRAGATATRHPSQRGTNTPPRQIAPDDDPDFLANLDFERRRAQQRNRTTQQSDATSEEASRPDDAAGAADRDAERTEGTQPTTDGSAESPTEQTPE